MVGGVEGCCWMLGGVDGMLLAGGGATGANSTVGGCEIAASFSTLKFGLTT